MLSCSSHSEHSEKSLFLRTNEVPRGAQHDECYFYFLANSSSKIFLIVSGLPAPWSLAMVLPTRNCKLAVLPFLKSSIAFGFSAKISRTTVFILSLSETD